MTSSTSSLANISSSNGLASFTGLASGIDTATLVKNLMAMEAAPQAALKTRLSTNQAVQSALQSINGKLAALATAATAMGSASSLDARTASVTSPSDTASGKAFSVTTTGTPATGSLDISVTRVAAAERHEFTGNTGTGSGWAPPPRTGSPATFPLSLVSGGVSTTLSAASYSAIDVAAAINKSSSGVSAAAIAGDDGVTHLVLTAKSGDYSSTATYGANAGFALVLKDSGNADVVSGVHAGPADRAGADASITINGITKSSKSNTFTSVVDGLDLTLESPAVLARSAGQTPVATVAVAADPSATAKSAANLTTQIASLLTEINFQLQAPAPGTSASATTGGLLAGNSVLRGIAASMSEAIAVASSAVGATSPATGLSVTPDGVSVTSDISTLTAFLTQNPSLGRSLLSDLSRSVSDAATAASKTGDASDISTGSVTRLIADIVASNAGVTSAISDWDTRLAQRKANLTARYTAMETALSKLQSQSSALTTALKQLETNN